MGWISQCADFLKEEFGYPISLARVISEYPDFRVSLKRQPCIAAWSVPHWHEFGKWSRSEWSFRADGELMGWKTDAGGEWRSFTVRRAELTQLAQQKITDGWTCDISDIHGFSASKSDLENFSSTDEMVEANSREMIDQISLAKLEKNLAHDEIRILHRPNGGMDYFARYHWDKRLWLMNEGGSHHTAAAKYISTRIGHPVPMSGRLYEYSLNERAVASLRRDYEIFVVGDDAWSGNAFFEAMKAVRATWLWHQMPKVFEGSRAIYLPRENKRSMRAAEVLRDADFVDLGELLSTLACPN